MRVLAWPKSKNRAQNPFQSLLYSAVDRQEGVDVAEFGVKPFLFGPKVDVLHIHWPDVFLATGHGWRFWFRYCLIRFLFAVAALRQTPVVWTAHNLKRTGQRNSKQLELVFWPWFTKRIDGLIYMTKASKIDAEQQLPELAGIPSSIIPHGHYLAAIEESLQGQDALASTDAPSSSQAGGYLFFGSITRYKNAHKLLQAFLQLPTGSAQLTIKGKMSASSPDNDLTNLLNTLPPERTSDVIFENRFLSEDELVDAIQCSDLVVFPYSDVLNSGAALFALSVGRPILASDTALFRELRSQVGEDWVRLIDGELDAAQLSVALDQARVQKTKGLAPDLSVFDWNRIAKQTVDFYQHVIDAQKGPKA